MRNTDEVGLYSGANAVLPLPVSSVPELPAGPEENDAPMSFASRPLNADEDSPSGLAAQLQTAASPATELPAGPRRLDTHYSNATRQPSTDAVGPGGGATPTSFADPSVLADIRAYHRERCFAMEQRKRVDLALGSHIRTALGWKRDLPEKERAAIAKRAAAIMKNPEGSPFEDIVTASVQSRDPWDAIEADNLKQLKKAAEQLAVWADFGEAIRGFGAGSLGVIVAEAGDLGNYANPGKLWKRFGLAYMDSDGCRQGGLPKNASAERWIAHGYNKQRRSRVWNIGDALIKAQVRKGGASLGEYGALYLERKAYEVARDPEIRPIVAHRRAQRYMEKRLLRNLWSAWRRAFGLLEPGAYAPAAKS